MQTLKPFDNWFLIKEEPAKSCLQFLRQHILKQNASISESWKYGMPFFTINGKMICYLWIHKKFKLPYIGIVEVDKITHPELIKEKRARMKILLIDPTKNIQVKKINSILKEVISLYKKPK